MIYVGTCGYAYKDWIGPFYPATIKQPEMLSYYAQRFSAVEIDATYYGILTQKTIASMAERTPDLFRFCFKVPRTLTHEPSSSRVHPDAALFRASMQPMLDAKKLGCALLQFPNGFRSDDAAEAYLGRLAHALEGLPIVVEFRHAAWQDAKALDFLAGIGAGWCNVDMPQLESLPKPGADVSGPVGYVRFHGRNAAQWWNGTSVTRYAYDYQAPELIPWVHRIADIAGHAEEAFAFFNNHARGSAAQNADLLESLLDERFGPLAAASIAKPARKASSQTSLPGFA